MHRWIRSGWLCFGCVFLLIPLWSQAGVRSYVVRRLYEPGLKQKFNVVYSLRGDVRSSTFEQSLPITVDAQLEINTEVLKVFENGQARIRYSFRYVKQEVDFFAEKDLPPPFTDTIRITPGGFPAEDETTSKFRQAQKRETDEGEQKESSFPGLDFLPDAGVFLLWIGLDVVPGPFYPLPIGAVREGDEWQIRYPTPFLDTRGGKLSIEQATVYTYPATVKVIGVKEVRGRGLLIGVELKPEAKGARRFCEALKAKGILAKETHDNVIRFAPPLVIDKATIDWALPSIREVLNMA